MAFTQITQITPGHVICTRMKYLRGQKRSWRICGWCNREFFPPTPQSRYFCPDCKISPPTCTVPDCLFPRKHLLYCRRHYQDGWREKNAGRPFRPELARRSLPPKERLLAWRQVTEKGCWEWTGCKQYGYGVWSAEGLPKQVHRAAYILFVGPLADKEPLHHKCANRACFRPDHLERVTQAINNVEMLARSYYEKRIKELEDKVVALEWELERTWACLPRSR